MSKKDYQAIAAAFYQTHQHDAVNADYREGGHAALSAIEGRLADILKADNSAFNRELFREACETGKCRGMRQVRS